MTVKVSDVFETLKKSMLVDGYPLVVDLEKSHDSWIVDARDGTEYLDFFSYFATNPLGHNHPKINTPEFKRYMGEVAIHNPSNSDFYNTVMADFVDTFRRLAQPDGLPHVFWIAGGALGVENALKAAFDWKVRKNLAKGYEEELGTKIIHFRNAFHGRSGYTLSLTNTADPRKTMYFPKFEWPRISHPRVRFPMEGDNLRATIQAEQHAVAEIERAVEKFGDDIAGLIIEPIQGEGGDNHVRADFLKELRRLADEHEFMLIFDEVQSGVGLTGKMWACQNFDVRPDMISFGKKMQVCGFMSSDRVNEVDSVFKMSSRINSTWGGNLVDMARAGRYLEIIHEENLVENARVRGHYLVEHLEELARDFPKLVSQPRGRGLMCAFDLPNRELRGRFLDACFEKKLIVLASGVQAVRFRPALTITDQHIDTGIRIIRSVLKNMNP
jgi:L-lysine 6-transaminase